MRVLKATLKGALQGRTTVQQGADTNASPVADAAEPLPASKASAEDTGGLGSCPHVDPLTVKINLM